MMPKIFAHKCPTINVLDTVNDLFIPNFREQGVFQQNQYSDLINI